MWRKYENIRKLITKRKIAKIFTRNLLYKIRVDKIIINKAKRIK
jgi:hypothetical protein